jgi:hypothetical protein
MKDPAPTPLKASEFERRLLDAAKHEQIPHELKLRMSQAFHPALSTSAALGGRSRWWLLHSKPASWLILSGVVLAAGLAWRQLSGPTRALHVASAPRLETRLAAQAVVAPNNPLPAPEIAAAHGGTQNSASPNTSGARARANSLRDEIVLLDRASAALQQQTANQALALLQVYARRFPHGRLVPEAKALQIEALGLQGDRARASDEAGRFLHAYPQHPLNQRVQRWVAPKPQ